MPSQWVRRDWVPILLAGGCLGDSCLGDSWFRQHWGLKLNFPAGNLHKIALNAWMQYSDSRKWNPSWPHVVVTRGPNSCLFIVLFTTNGDHRFEHWHVSLRALLFLVLKPNDMPFPRLKASSFVVCGLQLCALTTTRQRCIM